MTAVSDRPRRKVFTFSSEGKRRPRVEFVLNDRTVRCVPTIDGLTLLEFAELAGRFAADDSEGQITDADAVAGAIAIRELLKRAIVPDDWGIFADAIRDPGNEVDIEGLAEISAWLVEQYSGNPTD